jgi:hypothetical protein
VIGHSQSDIGDAFRLEVFLANSKEMANTLISKIRVLAASLSSILQIVVSLCVKAVMFSPLQLKY